MNKGLYIVAFSDCIGVVWHKLIDVLSAHKTDWFVDCLDCLYETNLTTGYHSADNLLSELQDNEYVFAARMISYQSGQVPNTRIVTSDDYFGSNCESIVLCADGIYFEVFSKCNDLLLLLSDSFSNNEVQSIEWINDTLGGRSEFTV